MYIDSSMVMFRFTLYVLYGRSLKGNVQCSLKTQSANTNEMWLWWKATYVYNRHRKQIKEKKRWRKIDSYFLEQCWCLEDWINGVRYFPSCTKEWTTGGRSSHYITLLVWVHLNKPPTMTHRAVLVVDWLVVWFVGMWYMTMMFQSTL